MISSLGTFRVCASSIHPDQDKYAERGAMLLSNERGQCWYHVGHTLANAEWYIAIRDGVVVGCDQDATRLWPEDCEVLEAPEAVPAGSRWNGVTFLPPPQRPSLIREDGSINETAVPPELLDVLKLVMERVAAAEQTAAQAAAKETAIVAVSPPPLPVAPDQTQQRVEIMEAKWAALEAEVARQASIEIEHAS